MIALRDYQQAAVDSLLEYWGSGGGNGLIEIPTGGGKSLTMASLMRLLVTNYAGTRVLLMTHVQELVEQDAQAIQKLWPEAPIGIYSAGLGRRDKDAPILLGSVQSIYRQPDIVGERHVAIIDEAHLVSRKDSGQYQTVLKALRARVPSMRVAGFTATPFRTDSGLLTDGWRDTPALFDDIVYRIGVLDLIERGLLAPLVPYAPKTRLDVSSVRKQGGEYVAKDLQAAVDIADVNERAIDEILAAGAQRVAWIVFAAGVEHAKHLRDAIRARGIDTEMVLGDTPPQERKSIIGRYKRGELRCIVGNNVLTTGFDAPHIDLIAMLRPTASKGLHIQMLGRGLRTAPGKADCLVLDFAMNTLRHGPIDTIDGAKTPGAPGAPPAKECPECERILHISVMRCPCGYVFPEYNVPKYSAQSAGAAILSTQSEAIWYDVEGVIYRRHKKDGSPDSLRIDYSCGLGTVSHWVPLEHETAGGMARRWWERNSYSGVAPRSVDEALLNYADLRTPGRVQVVREGKYFRVVHWDYSVPSGTVIPVTRALELPGFSARAQLMRQKRAGGGGWLA